MRGLVKRIARQKDRGVVAVLSVFFVMMAVMFLALTVNVGRIMKTRGDLQHAADSAALAAAEGMHGDVATTNIARATAQTYINKAILTTGAKPLPLGTNDVTFGSWHFETEPCVFKSGNCDPGFEEDSGMAGTRLFAMNAIRVTARYSLPTIFSIWDTSGGRGKAAMSATATAITRRARVSCALPVAAPACRFENPCFMDHQGDFNCPLGSGSMRYKQVSFTSGLNNSKFLTPTPPTDNWALGPIDIQGRADWSGAKSDFVRAHTLANQSECQTEDLEFRSETAAMPAGTFDATHRLIEPFIEGMLGIATAGGGQTGTCTLGQPRVLPIVEASTCGDNFWPSNAVPTTGPMAGKVRILGYVTINVRSVLCSDGRTVLHDPANPALSVPAHGFPAGAVHYDCNDPANAARIQECTAPRPDDSGETPLPLPLGPCTTGCKSGYLRANVELYCDNPVGVGPNGSMALQPRLMR